MELKKRLLELQEPEYADFVAKLTPTLPRERILGIRMPQLRQLAREYSREAEAAQFIQTLPHVYYEENNLHGLLLGTIRDFDQCIAEVNRFLPWVDNWATCDMMSPGVLEKNPQALLQEIQSWMASGRVYTVRFGIGMLMRYYLGERFRTVYLDWVAELRSEEYYINMMIAWFFATALAKQYPTAVVYLQTNRLDQWTHNKTIQKACESLRIGAEEKAYLRILRRKT